MSGSPQPSMRFFNFLAARLDEDEVDARKALDVGHNWLVEEESIELWPDDLEPGRLIFPRKDHAHHAARWSPARVLREVEAKRKIVKRHFRRRSPDWDREDHIGFECAQCLNEYPCPTLALLAEPYAGHPDYLQEWRWRP